MSALPAPPLYEPPEEPPQPRPRQRWKPVLRWIAAAVGILVILVVVALIVVAHSQRFHRYVLRLAEHKASASLGTRVQARDFALHLSGSSPSLDLFDVVVYGAAPYSTPPLLEVDHIALGVHVVSLLRRAWYVSNVRIDHPVVRVVTDAHGKDNLPRTQSKSQSHTSVFDLAVRHALLDRGEVYYNDHKSVLNADLRELTFRSAYDASQQRYSGSLAYRDGRLQFGKYNPMPHDLDARFDATPSRFTLHRATLSSGRSRFVLDAQMEDYSQPRVQATYSVLLDAGEFRRTLNEPSVPEGVIQMTGSVRYQSERNRPLVQTVTLTGDLNSSGLDVQTPSLRARISDIAAQYRVSDGNLEVSDLRARLLGGELTGTMTMRDIAGVSRSRLQARLRGLSLANLKRLGNSPSLQQVALNGILNADADAAWGKTMKDLTARADATIKASAAGARGGSNAVPVNSAIHARYAAAKNQITLANSYLRTPQTSLTLNGSVSQRSSLQVQMQSTDLHELETLANAFRSSQQASQPLGLYGTASFNATVRGSTSAPQVDGQLNAANLRMRDTTWRLLRANISLSPSGASLRNVELEAVPRGRITLNGGVGLQRWSFSESSPLQMTLNASQLNVADLAKFAGSRAPVSGLLSANLSVHGSGLNPVGQGTVTLAQAKLGQEPVQSLNLNFLGNGNEVHGKLTVRLPAGPAQADFNYAPKQQGYRVQLEATGIRLAQLQTLKARNLNVDGVLNLKADGAGTFQNPQLTASVTVPQLKMQNQTISGLSLQTNVANHVANLALDSQVVNTSIRARGKVNLTGGYDAEATLDTQQIPMQALLAAYNPSQAANITGQTELHATLRGPLKNIAQIDAHATVPTLQVNYKNAVQIGAASPIRVDLTGGVLTLQRATIRGTDTNLELQGSIPTNNQAPMSLLVLGTVDMRLAQLINPDIKSSGQIRFNIDSSGNRADPNVQGQVQIINANVASGDLPTGLQNGNGVLTLTRDRLNITRFEGTLGGGKVTASGGVAYRPSLGFNLALEANNVRLLYPEGVRETMGARLTLTGNPQAAHLGGNVRIENLSFAPDFDPTAIASSGGGAPAPPSGFEQSLHLDVGLQTTSNLNLTARAAMKGAFGTKYVPLSLAGSANLRITGTAAEPVVLGRVNLTSGDLVFNGNRYVLQSAMIDFANPSQTQANVNLTATATIQQYNIRVQLQGPSDRLHANYSSDPPLPPADIINLLGFGKTTEASAANPAPGNLGAESAVASAVSGEVTSQVQKVAGISHLAINPLLGCNQQTPGSCITVQQRATGQIYVTFQTDVNAIQRETIQVEYKATPRVTISGTRDQNGGFGFDTRINKNW